MRKEQIFNQTNANDALTDDVCSKLCKRRTFLQGKTLSTYKVATTFSVVDRLPYFDNEA
jgi:hypothetical protein